MAIKRREDSFFGLHFDFHATPQGLGGGTVGERTREEDIREICERIRPDFLQIDCKGHPGYSSYPTRAGTAVSPIQGDPLKLWRRVTKEEGVALYMHYSGVIDERAIEEHPEYACVGPDGQPDAKVTSTFGPYAEERLIPQLLELAGEYGVDGVWIDGECWGTKADYSQKALAAFREEMGIDVSQNPPVEKGDPYYEEYRDFCRRRFFRYVGRYLDAVHEKYPQFQIASNWIYSARVPQPAVLPVDFLSGDYSPSDSFNSARYEGRCLAPQGKPWDLMAWNFRCDFETKWRCPKHPAQMTQEAAAVMALGGGFQSYITQNPDGSPKMNQIRGMEEVARFCRQRQPFCHKGQFVPQAVILNSTTDFYLSSPGLFLGGSDSISGWTELMCESQQSVEIRSEHNLTGNLSRWPLVVVPGIHEKIEESFIDELLSYAREGGSLILSGGRAIAAFSARAEGGLPLPEDGIAVRYLSHDRAMWSGFEHPFPVFRQAAGEVFGWAGDTEDGDGNVYPAVQLLPYGKGKILLSSLDFGEYYHGEARTVTLRRICKKAAAALYRPMVEVEGSMYVDLVVLQKDGRYLIQLVNTGGGHADKGLANFDEIPPVGPLSLSIALPSAPSEVRLQPDGKPLEGVYRDGRLHLLIDRVEIHSIVEILP